MKYEKSPSENGAKTSQGGVKAKKSKVSTENSEEKKARKKRTSKKLCQLLLEKNELMMSQQQQQCEANNVSVYTSFRSFS